jgi:type I restriction enzyme S subunit
MEVRPGYKQTEVGVIPEGWTLKRIGDTAEVRGRVGWKGYTKRDLVPSGPYAIGAKHIDEQCRLNLSEPTYLSRAKYLESPEIMVHLGDILIVQRGSIGKLVLIEEEIGEATINPSMVIVRTMESSPSFIRYFLLSRQGQKQVLSDTSSTGVPMISQRQIANFQIAFPPTIEEQRAIAVSLSDVDALLGGLERLITKKRDLKQAAMQQLLTGQTRLPGFSGEWEVKSIGELAGGDENIVDGPFGSNLKNSDYLTTGIPVLQGLNITGDRFVWKEVRYISKKKAKELFRSNAQIGDLLTVKIGSVGFCALIDYLDGHQFAIIPANLLRIRFLGNMCDPVFLYYILSSTQGKQMLRDIAANTAQPALGLKGFRKILIPVPNSVKEQTAIASILSDMDAEIAALEARRDKTRALKQGMMQELLTGKTRLI